MKKKDEEGLGFKDEEGLGFVFLLLEYDLMKKKDG